jgi:hypothetical protein
LREVEGVEGVEDLILLVYRKRAHAILHEPFLRFSRNFPNDHLNVFHVSKPLLTSLNLSKQLLQPLQQALADFNPFNLFPEPLFHGLNNFQTNQFSLFDSILN